MASWQQVNGTIASQHMHSEGALMYVRLGCLMGPVAMEMA